ncbi:hypothetical protein SDC9_166822 [bioreactor metagenome]|uniref:Uncharacterized protein n=1 Tax=bioreactor metagenome TaxID=1076179 RepID=A0A645G6A2_9ZZZZ
MGQNDAHRDKQEDKACRNPQSHAIGSFQGEIHMADKAFQRYAPMGDGRREIRSE